MNWKMVGISVVLAAVLGVSFIVSRQYLRTAVVTSPTTPDAPVVSPLPPKGAVRSGPTVVRPYEVVIRTTAAQEARIRNALAEQPLAETQVLPPQVEASDTEPLFAPADIPVDAPVAAEPAPAVAAPATGTATPTPSMAASPTPSGDVQGSTTSTKDAILTALPELAAQGDQIQDVRFVVPKTAAEEASGEDHAIYRWLLITLIGEHQEVAVRDLETLAPLPAGPFLADTSDRAEDSLVRAWPPRKVVTEAQAQALERQQQFIAGLNDKGFEEIEAVQVVNFLAEPNDPYISSKGSWGQTYDDLWGLKAIEAPAAWDITTGSANVVVAVIDGGVDATHPDIDGNLWENPGEVGTDARGRDKKLNGVDDDGNTYTDDWQGWDFHNNDNNPDDESGHGTHVAGTIAARGNNETGVVGVMWQARLMPLRALGPSGGSIAAAAAAIKYAANHGAQVANNSWGGVAASAILHDAVKYASGEQGMLLVASAGNDGIAAVKYPAAYPEVISVGATTTSNTRANFSSYGDALDIMAPGGNSTDTTLTKMYNNILSLRAAAATFPAEYTVGTTLARLRGTSMAAPHVTGVAGLLLALHPEWNAEDVRTTLLATADDVGVLGHDYETGEGRVNANRAVSIDAPEYITARITSPESGFNITATQQTVEIRGAARGRPFSRYTVEVGQGHSPTAWTTDTITLAHSGTAEVTDGVLATWNVAALNRTGEVYTVRLTVYLTDGTTSASIVRVAADSSVRPGWPKTAPLINTRAIPMIGNVLGDDKKEVVVHYPDVGIVRLFDADGKEHKTGWPQNVALGEWELVTVTVANIVGDTHDEVLIGESKGIYAVNSEGRVIGNWYGLVQAPLTEVIVQRPTVADIDADGKVEVLFYTIDIRDDDQGIMKVYSIEQDGTRTPGWPKVIANPNQRYIHCNSCTPVVPYDINGDGTLELIFAVTTYLNDPTDPHDASAVYVLSNEGVLLPGWPKQLTTTTDNYHDFVNALLVGDIKGDASPEIIMVKNGRGGAPTIDRPLELRVIDRTLNESVIKVPGHAVSGISNFSVTGAALFDVDRDGKQDVVLGPHVIKGDGTSPPAWVSPTVDGQKTCSVTFCLPQKILRGGPILADVGGSEELEIITAPEWDDDANSLAIPVPVPYITAHQFNGTALAGWPKLLTAHLNSSYNPVAADLDTNGTMEVVAALESGVVMVWNTPGKPAAGEWKLPHNTERHYRWFAHKLALTTPTPPVPTSTIGAAACAQANPAAFALLDVSPKDGRLTAAEADAIIQRIQTLLNNCSNNSCYAGNEQYDLNKDRNLTGTDLLHLINMRNSCIKL